MTDPEWAAVNMGIANSWAEVVTMGICNFIGL